MASAPRGLLIAASFPSMNLPSGSYVPIASFKLFFLFEENLAKLALGFITVFGVTKSP